MSRCERLIDSLIFVVETCRIEWTKRHGHGCQLLVFNWHLVTRCYFVCFALINSQTARQNQKTLHDVWMIFLFEEVIDFSLPRKLPQLWHLLHLGTKGKAGAVIAEIRSSPCTQHGAGREKLIFFEKKDIVALPLAFSFLFMSSKECTEIGVPQKSHRNVSS